MKWAVVNMTGTVVGHDDSNLDKNILRRFPQLAVELWYSNLVGGATFFRAKPDLSSCLMVWDRNPTNQEVELWDLSPQPRKRWTWARRCDIPDFMISQPDWATIEGKELIVVGCGDECVLLDAITGKLVKAYSYGRDHERERSYWASCQSIVPLRLSMACGGFGSKRVRIVDFSPLHRQVVDVGDLGGQWFGEWLVTRLEYAMDGRLLQRECNFDSRIRPNNYETTVFDTKTWKVVWQRSDNGYRWVSLSHDGKVVAVFRRRVLEIFPSGINL